MDHWQKDFWQGISMIDKNQFPLEIQRYCDGNELEDYSCHSGAAVYRLSNGYYLKIAHAGALQQEVNLTRLMNQLGYGANVNCYITTKKDYLMTEEVPGKDGTNFLDYPKELCQRYAQALRTFHQQSIVGFPISQKMLEYHNCDVNRLSFDTLLCWKYSEIHDSASAKSLLKQKGHLLKADCLIHGDACLTNVMINQDSVNFIDMSMSGYGNRHIDLYWALWSLEFNLGTDAYTDFFLDCYGREDVDPVMFDIITAYEMCE